jgi:hypothetical protein
MALHDVLPSTQKPPPLELATQTHDALELHGTNVAHVAAAHSGFGFDVLCACAAEAEPRIIGATYATLPKRRDCLISSRRLVLDSPAMWNLLIASGIAPPAGIRTSVRKPQL